MNNFLSQTALVLVLLLPSCKPRLDNQLSSISEPGDGKWLATVSVGGEGVSKESTLLLRNMLTKVFTSPRGGGYQHAIDLDDKSFAKGKVMPTVKNVVQKFTELANKIKAFRSKNPSKQTMVTIGLTGHGLNINGSYEFVLAEEEGTDMQSFSGEMLVQLLQSLQADEVILVMQSCHSGASMKNFTRFTNGVGNLAQRKNLRLAIVTPVSGHIESYERIWENDILANAFGKSCKGQKDESCPDIDLDGLISYQEWKDFVVRKSCENPAYLPKSLFSISGSTMRGQRLSGLDPQFFEHGIRPTLPLVYASDSAVGKSSLKTSQDRGFSTQLSAKTQSICRQKTANLAKIWRYSIQDIGRLVSASSTPKNIRSLLIHTLGNRNFSNESISALFLQWLNSSNISKTDVMIGVSTFAVNVGDVEDGPQYNQLISAVAKLGETLPQFKNRENNDIKVKEILSLFPQPRIVSKKVSKFFSLKLEDPKLESLWAELFQDFLRISERQKAQYLKQSQKFVQENPSKSTVYLKFLSLYSGRIVWPLVSRILEQQAVQFDAAIMGQINATANTLKAMGYMQNPVWPAQSEQQQIQNQLRALHGKSGSEDFQAYIKAVNEVFSGVSGSVP